MGKHKKDPNLAVIDSLTDEQLEKMWEIYNQMAEFEMAFTRRGIENSKQRTAQWEAMNDKLTALHPNLHYDLIQYVIDIWGEERIGGQQHSNQKPYSNMNTTIIYQDEKTEESIFRQENVTLIPNVGDIVEIEDFTYRVIQKIFTVKEDKTIVNIFTVPVHPYFGNL